VYYPWAPQQYGNGGELADLYYDQGITPAASTPFTNLVIGPYWYADPFYADPNIGDPLDSSWAFNFSNGYHC
jgi:hypothetical protein